MSYMEATDTAPQTRPVQALMAMLDERYAKTDTERPWDWLKEFATFAKKHAENLNDFRARLLRVAARLETMGVEMNEDMMPPQSLKALKLSEGKLPIALSAMETKPNSQSVGSLKDVTIKMSETRRRNPDTSEVYQAQGVPDTATMPDSDRCDTDGQEDWEEDWDEADEYEWQGEVAGAILLIKPKRHTKARNTPGAAVAAQKGSINRFRHMRNGTPAKGTEKGLKGRIFCRRCGSPDRFWKDCPRPYNPDIFGTKGKGKGKPGTGGKGKSTHCTTIPAMEEPTQPGGDGSTAEDVNYAEPGVNPSGNSNSESIQLGENGCPDAAEYDHWASYYTQRSAENWSLYYSLSTITECALVPETTQEQVN